MVLELTHIGGDFSRAPTTVGPCRDLPKNEIRWFHSIIIYLTFGALFLRLTFTQ